jgi:hypothetical protein
MATSDFTKLNPRKVKYIEARSQGLSKREAKNLAGYAASTSSYSVENSSVKAALARLIRQAVPAHLLVRRIAEGVSAEETKFFQKEGIVTDQRNVIAWSERREYLKLAAEYGRYVEAKAEESGQSNASVGIVLINGVTRPKNRDNSPSQVNERGSLTDRQVLPDAGETQATSFTLVNRVTRHRGDY